MSDPFFAVAGEKVDNGNFYHRVASRLLLHGSACHAYQYLCGQCGVVDTHIKFDNWFCVLPDTPLRVRFTP